MDLILVPKIFAAQFKSVKFSETTVIGQTDWLIRQVKNWTSAQLLSHKVQHCCTYTVAYSAEYKI